MGNTRKAVSGKEKVAVPVFENESRRWGELNPEILAFIFVRLPADEMVRIVPLVCKPWMEAVAGPYCWRDIDVAEWSRRRNDSHAADIAVIKLVRWSDCTFHRLSVYCLGSPGFIFVANRGRCLTTLQIPKSNINDNVVLNHIEALPNLKELDISECSNITAKGLEAFGNQCKSLVYLKRNMTPKRFGGYIYIPPMNNSEAKVIANTMLKLQHLELCYNSFDDAGLSEILANCKSLTHLDIEGSSNVRLEGDLKESLLRIKYFHYVRPRNNYIDQPANREVGFHHVHREVGFHDEHDEYNSDSFDSEEGSHSSDRVDNSGNDDNSDNKGISHGSDGDQNSGSEHISHGSDSDHNSDSEHISDDSDSDHNPDSEDISHGSDSEYRSNSSRSEDGDNADSVHSYDDEDSDDC